MPQVVRKYIVTYELDMIDLQTCGDFLGSF